MDAQLKAQLKQIVTLQASAATVNAFGEIQTATATAATFFCRVEAVVNEYERLDGTFAKAGTMIVLDVDASMTTPTFDTRIWLPQVSASSAALARKPKIIQPAIDERGQVDWWEISL